MISIILPVYNASPYLKQCIESILKQTYINFELIIINDGSTDNSLEICIEFENLDNRILLINQENKGIGFTRNLGLEKASGEYIYWVDADDWIEKDTIEILYNAINQYSANIAVCGYVEEYNSTKKIYRNDKSIKVLNKVDFYEKIILEDNLKSYLWDKLCKKQVFENVTFPENRYFEDYSVLYKIAYNTEKIVLVNQAKYHYRQHNNSICRFSNSKKEYDFFLAIREKIDFLSKTSNLGDLKKQYEIIAIRKILRTLKILLINNDIDSSNYIDSIIKYLAPYKSIAKKELSSINYIKFYLAINHTKFYSWILSKTKNKKTYQKI